MNLNEDDELLGLFTKQCAPSEPVEPLKRRIKELEEENKALFEKLDAQSTTIRRYRAVLRQAIEKKISPNSPVAAPLPPPLPPPPPKPPLAVELPIQMPDTKETRAPPVPQQQQPVRADSGNLVAYTMAGVLAEAPISSQPVLKKSRPNDDPPVAQQCGGLITDKKIRCPSHDRPADGYAETLVGQTIWSAIVQFFNSTPNANLMDENMIIKQVGNLLLRDQTKPFLDSKMIHRYFSHPFTFTDDDQTMTVRTRIINGKPVWLVFIPDWLKAEWRSGGGAQAVAR